MYRQYLTKLIRSLLSAPKPYQFATAVCIYNCMSCRAYLPIVSMTFCVHLTRYRERVFCTTGTRESAFVHAISTVGVSHAVTRSCSSGSFDQCGCDRTVWGKSRKGDFEWAGCSDNIAYGNAFSKTFVDARERTRGSHADRALMNLHNNNAGRQVCDAPREWLLLRLI